jgi:hypothetical protein
MVQHTDPPKVTAQQVTTRIRDGDYTGAVLGDVRVTSSNLASFDIAVSGEVFMVSVARRAPGKSLLAGQQPDASPR